MNYNTAVEAFEDLSRAEKRLFIETRIHYASDGALCGEMNSRLSNIQK